MVHRAGYPGRMGPPAGGRRSTLIDFLVGGGVPSYMTFTRASSGTFFDNTGALQTATNDVPRFDHDPSTLAPRGLMIEAASTNSTRNGQATGATAGVLGSGGAMPTNWGFSGGVTAGLTCTVVGSGTENGIGYVEFRLNGTTTGTSIALITEGAAAIAASSGQTWTGSLYCKLVSGSLTNITQTYAQLSVIGGSGTTNGTVTVLTTAAIGTQRLTATTASTGAGTTAVRAAFVMILNNTSAVDVTLRVGGVQVENLGFATSYIPTTSTATARAAETCTISSLSSVGLSTGASVSFVHEFERMGNSLNRGILAFDDNSGNETIALRSDSTTATSIVLDVIDGGASQAALTFTGGGAGAVRKFAARIGANDVGAALSGTATQTDTSVTMPAYDRLRLGNALTSSTTGSFGWHRRLTVLPRLITDAEIQAFVA